MFNLVYTYENVEHSFLGGEMSMKSELQRINLQAEAPQMRCIYINIKVT